MSDNTPPELVTLLTERALAVSAGSARPPSSVRVVAGEVQVEITWPEAARPGPGGTEVPPAAAQAPVVAAEPGEFTLDAETVGVFYRAPEPGKPPFVGEGDVVRAGQQVGIVEAMKLMIPVTASRAGRVVEVLVADGEPVEHGQPLMVLTGVES